MALVGTISGSNGTSNTAITGTLVIANTAGTFPPIASDTVLFVSGNIGGVSKSVIGGDLVISGSTSLGTTVERILTSTGGTGTVSFDTTFNSIFYVNGPSGDITANFTNVPTANNRVLTPTVILSQSATPRTITAVQVNSVSSSILWANSTTPTATANKQDVFGFSLIRSGSAYKVLGQMSTYG